jgi:hypothetical protein
LEGTPELPNAFQACISLSLPSSSFQAIILTFSDQLVTPTSGIDEVMTFSGLKALLSLEGNLSNI